MSRGSRLPRCDRDVMSASTWAEGHAWQVRPATLEDASVLAELYLRSWFAGYDGLVDPATLMPVAAERATYDWPAAIVDPGARLGLGLVDGSPAGITKVGPDPTEEVRGTWLELLYVAPEFWGTGVAAALLRWAAHQASSLGAQFMRLRVVEGQGRARRFYEREGWSYDSEVPPSRNAFFPLLCMRSNLTSTTRDLRAPSAGLEPAHTAPEADALSAELRGRGRAAYLAPQPPSLSKIV